MKLNSVKVKNPINAIFSSVPVDVPDASAYPLVFAALLESTEFNWTDEDLGKVASGNLIR